MKLYSPLGQHRQKAIIKYNKIYILMIRDKHTPDLGYA